MSEESFNMTYKLQMEKIQEICKSISGSIKVSNVSFMNKGLSAYMVLVEFEKTPSWMIRVINPRYKMVFEREMGAILHARNNLNLPTPKILKMDSSGKIIPESYYVYEFVEGDTLGHKLDTIPFNVKLSIYNTLGEYLGKMHLDQRTDAGVLLYNGEEFIFDPFELKFSLSEEMYRGQEEDFQWALDHEFKEHYNEFYEDCSRIWNSHKKFIKSSKNPIGFSHCDLLADNLIINKGKIAAIIDWEQGCYGDVLYDLARTERGIFRRIVFLSEAERDKLREVFLSSYHNFRPIEPVYWNLRVAYHIVQCMDDLGQIPEYRERFPKDYCDKVEKNLIDELKEYIRNYNKKLK